MHLRDMRGRITRAARERKRDLVCLNLDLLSVRCKANPSDIAESRLNSRLFNLCIKGVTGIIFDTVVYIPKWSDFYLTRKRDQHGFYTK